MKYLTFALTKGRLAKKTLEMLEKLGYVADYEGRSINSHVLVLIRESIKGFEAEHGIIEGPVSPEVNVKPPRKG